LNAGEAISVIYQPSLSSRADAMLRVARSRLALILRRYAVAVWTVGLASAATLLLTQLMPPGVSPLFLLAIVVSAWKGGLGPGILATALSALVTVFLLLPPVFTFEVGREDGLQLVVFIFVAIVIGMLSASRGKAEAERKALLQRERAARIAAERASAVKDEFLAAASHELRTPLTTVKILTRMLLRKDPPERERREYLRDIASECDRQIDLVDNLLDSSRIEAGGVQIKPGRVNAIEVIRACERSFRVQAAEHRHELSIDVAPAMPLVNADSNGLRRSLSTIVENAIKYTPDGGRIYLRTYSVGNQQVVIEIEDNGRGIHPEDLPHIFDKFYRGRVPGSGAGGASASPPEIQGIGLGLYLARVLVEGMKGSIEARSEIGVGTTVILRLPASDEIQLATNAGRGV
jgi:signal transduction histidine kinase